MSNFAKLQFTESTDNLVKRSATVEIRRYKKYSNGRVIVKLSSGWTGCSEKSVIASSKSHARELIKNHLAG